MTPDGIAAVERSARMWLEQELSQLTPGTFTLSLVLLLLDALDTLQEENARLRTINTPSRDYGEA